LSRLPLNRSDLINDRHCDNCFIGLITSNVHTVFELDIANEIKKDQILQEVYLMVATGKCPSSIKNVKEELKPFFNRRNELTIELGYLLRGHRLVIPKKFQDVLLQELHNTYMGTVKMKKLARSYVWWPRIDRIDCDIENNFKKCEQCLTSSDNPPKSVLHSWPGPEGPGMRAH